MITVHDKDLCRELLGFEMQEETSAKHKRARSNVILVTPSTSRLNTSHSQLLRAQDWLSRKARRKIMVKAEIQCNKLYIQIPHAQNM
jgi:hypothetical protein